MFITVIVRKGLCISYGGCEGKCIKSIPIVGSKNTKTFCRGNEGKNCVIALYWYLKMYG